MVKNWSSKINLEWYAAKRWTAHYEYLRVSAVAWAPGSPAQALLRMA